MIRASIAALAVAMLMLAIACASTAPGRGWGASDAAIDSVISMDGSIARDTGPCPPMTFTGSPCTNGTSCWKDCFNCVGGTTFDKIPPVTLTCVSGGYASEKAVTCFQGRYRDPLCTMLRD